MERRNAWTTYNAEELKKLNAINEDYKKCLDAGKTERECIALTIERAEAAGYKNIKDVIKSGEKVQAGDKIYAVCMNKMIAMFNMGTKPLEEGINILGAHIDSPRIDVKQNPLYENEEFAYLDTHYYGGIKKYQWVTIPLAIHGVIVKKDGTVVNVNIGEKDEDPVFVITDLLIHLASKQMDKKAAGVVEGENLDLLIGSRPIEQDESLEKKEKEAKETKEEITIDDFSKIQLKVGKVIKCEKHPNADKLLVSQIDVGEETPRQIVSGIADVYSPEEFVGKKVIVVTNLKPAKLRGVESQGMVLAGGDKKVLGVVDAGELPVGTTIR